MLNVRKGGPSSGYVSTGFYTGKHLTPSFSCVEHIMIGLTLGRVVLLEVTKKVKTLYLPSG